MNTIVVWLLVMWSSQGTSVAPAQFASKADCEHTATQVPAKTKCVSAIVIGVRP